jgi:hypothetical protein
MATALQLLLRFHEMARAQGDTRTRRGALGEETVRILKDGSYQIAGDEVVDIAARLDACVNGSLFVREGAYLPPPSPHQQRLQGGQTRVLLIRSTTLECCR